PIATISSIFSGRTGTSVYSVLTRLSFRTLFSFGCDAFFDMIKTTSGNRSTAFFAVLPYLFFVCHYSSSSVYLFSPGYTSLPCVISFPTHLLRQCLRRHRRRIRLRSRRRHLLELLPTQTL